MTGGRGHVATQDIERGTLICEEGPLIICDTHITSRQWQQQRTAFFAGERAGTTSLLQAVVGQLGPHDLNAFNALYQPPSPGNAVTPALHVLVDRVQYNAWEVRANNRNSTNKRIHLCVYGQVSVINHSCVPNAVIETLNDPDDTHPRGWVRLIASRPVPQNAEIFISYIPNDLFKTQLQRAHKSQDWGFLCTCIGCADITINPRERDTAALFERNLPRHDAIGNIDPLNIEMHIGRLTTYVILLNNLGVWDGHLANARWLLASLHMRKGKYEEAFSAAMGGRVVKKYMFDQSYKARLDTIIGESGANSFNLGGYSRGWDQGDEGKGDEMSV